MDSTAVLLLPESAHAAALTGASELIVQDGVHSTPARYFLHIFDEEERKEKIKTSSSVSAAECRVHERCLAELKSARDTLWADKRVRQFLPSADPLLWPETAALHEVADVVRQLCQYGSTAPESGVGEALLRAVSIIERETRYCGVHPIKSAPVAGQLVPYEVHQWLHSTSQGRPPLPDTLVKKPMKKPLLPSAWMAELSTPVLMASDALRLPMTAATTRRLVELVCSPLTPSTVDTAQQWQSVLSARERNLARDACDLAGSVQDYTTALHIQESELARLMQNAAEANAARVRLRTGVLVTVLHRPLLYLVCGRGTSDLLTDEEIADFHRLTGADLDTLALGGLARVVPINGTQQSVERLVREVFLSPVWCDAVMEDCCSLENLGHVGPNSTNSPVVYRVTAQHNPFLVFHGSRVARGFKGNEGVLRFLKRERDDVMHDPVNVAARAARVAEALQEDRGSRTSSGRGPRQPVDVTTLRGDALRVAVDRAVVGALASAALTRAELTAHPALAAFTSLPQLDVFVKASLKAHTECRGRKYFLRQ